MRRTLDIMFILPLVAFAGAIVTTAAYAELAQAAQPGKVMDYAAIVASAYPEEERGRAHETLVQTKVATYETQVDWALPAQASNEKVRVQFGVALAGLLYDFNSGDTKITSAANRNALRDRPQPYTYLGVDIGL